MTKELIWFEKLISSDLKELPHSHIPTALLQHYSHRIQLEFENSQKEIFNDITINKYPKAKAKTKIWNYQKTITRLMDLLYAQNPDFWTNESHEDQESLPLHVYNGLVHLREFLLKYFPLCCNALEKQSVIDYIKLNRYTNQSIDLLKQRFMPYTNESLFQAMISPLTGFISKKKKNITLNQARFIKCYQDHLLGLKVGVNRTSFYEDCKESIFRYNLNSPRVFRYFTLSLQNQISSQATIKEQINLLHDERHKINRFYSKPKLKYREDLPSLKLHLTEWINDEIRHLEREVNMNSKINETITSSEASLEHTKLPTHFSVPELSILLRLLNEVGGIKSNSISATTKWASECLESKKAKSISPESLRAKYYEPSSTSLQRVEKYLKQMLALLKQMG